MSKAKEALESIMLRAKEGRNKEQQKYIESNYELVKQSLDELEELKKDISRFLYLQTGRIPFTGAFVQDFIIENKPHPLADQFSVERNLKREYKELKEKLELVGEKDE